MKNIKIVSNGTGRGTRVLDIDGKVLDLPITRIDFKPIVAGEFVGAVIHVDMVDVEIVANLNNETPEVTPAMVDAAYITALANRSARKYEYFSAIYRAMRLARPLSDGPGA